MEALARHGLTGPAQHHVAPVAMMADARAHQVFTGFESDWPLVKRVLSGLSGLSPVWSDGKPVTWDACPPCRELVVPAWSLERPTGLAGLVWVVDRLLGPGGCPWDMEQTHTSLKKYLVEESYELIDAIDRSDERAMVEELGDVLLQPLMHAQMEARDGNWDIQHVAETEARKLVHRHPHVFGENKLADADAVLKQWDAIKKAEKGGTHSSVLAGVPQSAPALLRAMEISKRAARAGFEWPDMDSVWDKFAEETREVREALAQGDKDHIAAEFGDLLFTVVNLARWAKVDPEDALRTMVDRFIRRFRHMESQASQDLKDLSPDEWEGLWAQAKAL